MEFFVPASLASSSLGTPGIEEHVVKSIYFSRAMGKNGLMVKTSNICNNKNIFYKVAKGNSNNGGLIDPKLKRGG